MIPAHGTWQVLAAFVAIAACGGGGGGPTDPAGPPGPGGPALTASVAMNAYSDPLYGESGTFSPASVTIARSGTVTWTNGSGTAHNVTFAGSGAPANIPDHNTGSNARTFSNAGSFSYRCTNHTGMSGTVTVQ